MSSSGASQLELVMKASTFWRQQRDSVPASEQAPRPVAGRAIGPDPRTPPASEEREGMKKDDFWRGYTVTAVRFWNTPSSGSYWEFSQGVMKP